MRQGTAKGSMAGLWSIDIWPWNFEPSRSRSQTKVPMETTHEGLSTTGLGTMKLNAKKKKFKWKKKIFKKKYKKKLK